MLEVEINYDDEEKYHFRKKLHIKKLILGLLVLASTSASDDKKIICDVVVTDSGKVVPSSKIQGNNFRYKS